jgi:hypothetical protein
LSTKKLTASDINELEKKIQRENGINYTGPVGLGYNGNWFLVEVENGRVKHYRNYLELLEDPVYLERIRKAMK